MTLLEKELIERLKNTILIKVGDKRVKLGRFSIPPRVNCRVISEELYQEVLSALEQQIEEQESISDEEIDDMALVLNKKTAAFIWAGGAKMMRDYPEHFKIK